MEPSRAFHVSWFTATAGILSFSVKKKKRAYFRVHKYQIYCFKLIEWRDHQADLVAAFFQEQRQSPR